MTIRLAMVADAPLIAEQRRRMFVDSGQSDPGSLHGMVRNFVEWVRPRLEDGSYVGWVAEEEGVTAGGAGLWVMEFPPHFLHEETGRAYLLNFYTAPGFRGRGLAGEMLRLALEEAKRRGLKVVTLHASKFGRPIYERAGFEGTNEMMLRAR